MLGVKFATAVAAVGNARYMVGPPWLPRNNKSRMLLQFLVTEWVAKDEGRWLKGRKAQCLDILSINKYVMRRNINNYTSI